MPEHDISQAEAVLRLADRVVWIVTSRSPAGRGGLLATWVAPASIDPAAPRVLAGIAPLHHTHRLIAESGAFAAHVIAEADIDLAWRFGLDSGRERDKLAGIETAAAPSGSPVLARALAWIDCSVVTAFDAGDRTFFLADVIAAAKRGDGEPLTESRLLALASAEDRARMRAMMLADIERLRPLRDAWGRRMGAAPAE